MKLLIMKLLRESLNMSMSSRNRCLFINILADHRSKTKQLELE